ncbi:uncharacterized protein EI90DRAFT_2932178 [Cantharellus anzutake]|uniref:uncharacterized protein n=1 Tax=Cantharellus anzutake TaxID=1750568 RepID=UPI001903B4C1|nr:uncharacterized protein EI90DRAFT_2932178 [Cantharellus anzutake]KAF8325404.1 hypothetical protein EI90DRAFT_2932178 [Cantharellus anzutake]
MLLTAVAGAGKTAIAHSIAERCVREGILLSSFFFKAGEPWRPDSMFSAIARSLAAYDPVYRAFINSTLRKDPSLSSAPFTTQFRRLVADPLRLRPPSSHRPAVIVIDALDECERNAFMLLADVFRKEVSKLPFSVKIFLTSREVSLVNDSLSLFPLIQRLNINLSSGENMHGCAKYVCSQLRYLKGPPLGPTEQDTLARRLSEQSGGLFIWINAIFRHVKTTNEASVATLKGLLETSADRTGVFAEIMAEFYTSVLEKCNWEDETFAHDYPIVLGAILNSRQPLCIAAWDAILSSSLQSSVKYTLTALDPVLMGVADPHTPIRLLDQSFHRFIIARTGSRPSGLRRYVLEAKKGCAWMATRCVEILREGLPSTEGLGLIRDLQRETELPCIPSETLSEHFRYACRQVVYHLNQVQEPSETLQGLVRTFLDQHIIQWVEVCVRSGQYISISSLPEWAKLGLGSTSKEAAHMLVKVLTKLGGNLAYFSRFEEAHEAVDGSVVLCRLLVSMGSESYDLDLAQLLTDLLTSLHKVRRHSRAITVVEECVKLCRELVALDPASHNPNMADSLLNQAVTLHNLGRNSEALQVYEECVKLHRELVALDPASHNPKLADSLHNQADTLHNLGRYSEALQVNEECVKLRRELVALDPASYNPNLASSLYNQAVTLHNLGRNSEALQVDEECVKLRRELVALDPASHNPKLADSLYNQAITLHNLGRNSEALQVDEECVKLRRELVALDPASHNPKLADSLYNQAVTLHNLGRNSEALQVDEECVKLRRELVALDPASHNPKLASSLHNQAVTLHNLGRYSEALQVNEECVKLRRELVALDPASHNLKLASSLHNQAVTLHNLGRYSEALQVNEECVKLRRELVALDPASYNPKLADSLHNQTITLRNLGRNSEALQVYEECVKLRHELVALDPASHNPKLADSLHN